jgi:hypothetical protein
VEEMAYAPRDIHTTVRTRKYTNMLFKERMINSNIAIVKKKLQAQRAVVV